MDKKVLIVGTVPFNKKTTSRAFDSYFSGWDKDRLAQIFSNTEVPLKGHCGELFQITDVNLLLKRFNKSIHVGTIYEYSELKDQNSLALETGKKKSYQEFLYSIGKHKTPLIYLLRKLIWSKNMWLTDKLDSWVEKFQPECIFISFSDDFFILEIGLYFAEKYNIPIISSIGDDYIFNERFSISPFYHIYRHFYKNLVERIFRHKGSAIFIGDKIKDKYNKEYKLKGETIFLTSDIDRREFNSINFANPVISYCGNISLGRYKSLIDIAKALEKIDESYKLDVYSNEKNRSIIRKLKKMKCISFHGSVPYSKVHDIILRSDLSIIVESFSMKNIRQTRFSVSTKIADLIKSGTNTFVYGPKDSGAVGYLYENNATRVCYSKKDLKANLFDLLRDVELQRKYYSASHKLSESNHNFAHNISKFRNIVTSLVNTSLKNKLTVVISSCDKFSDIWDAQVELFNRYWPDRSFRTILITDKPTDRIFSNIEVLALGDELDFSERIKESLKYIKSEKILLTLDDYFLRNFVKSSEIERLIEIMDSESISYCRLFPIPLGKQRFSKMFRIFKIEFDRNYSINLYPSIWSKDFLEKTFHIKGNPWDYEVSLTKIAKNLEINGINTFGSEYQIIDGIRKGRFLRRAHKYLQEEELYNSSRGVLPLITEIKLAFLFYIKEFLPISIFRVVKNTMKKLGVKFFSD